MAKAPLKITLRSTETDSITGETYLDDGTNTVDGSPAWRTYTGSAYEDLSPVRVFPKAVSIADATVADTVTETSIIGTLRTGDTAQIAANYLAVGDVIRVRLTGIASNTATPTLNIILKIGSTEIVSSGAITTASGLSNNVITVEATLTVRSIGASGTVIGMGSLMIDDTHYPLFNSSDITTVVTIDTTAAQTVDVTATWGTASASNTITGQTATIEVLR